MAINVGDKCLVLTDNWEDVKHYTVEGADTSEYVLREFDDFLKKTPTRTISKADEGSLFRSPYRIRNIQDYGDHAKAELTRDLASSIVRARGSVEVTLLLNVLCADARLTGTKRSFVEGCVRSSIASDIFAVDWDGRVKRVNRKYNVYLTEIMLAKEQQRSFVATFAANARVAYRINRSVELSLDVFNIFDRQVNDIQYAYPSRLPGEPAFAEGVTPASLHVHPSTPRAARVGLKVLF